MKKRIGFFIMAILFFISGCSEKEVSIDYILALLDDHDIAYEEQEEIHPSNELRETIDNHVFELEEGRLRVHFFATEEDRKEVQKDPYPAAVFVATSGYGKDNILIYYVSGNDELTDKLDTVFEDWECAFGCEP